jgi:DNA-binding XRE family transcriptional regulator
MEQKPKPKLKPPTQAQLRALRLGYGLTQVEAASIAMVSKRTWESWESESNDREIPISKFNLFVMRLTYHRKELEDEGIMKIKDSNSIRELVVINLYNGNDIQMLDVIANDNFLEIKEVVKEGVAFNVVSSLAVNIDGKPYVHRTKFSNIGNESSKTKLLQWQSILQLKSENI